MKRLLLAMILSIFFTAPAMAQMMDMPMMGQTGQGGGREQMMDMGGMSMMGNMEETCIQKAQELGLSADQIDKIMAIHREMEKAAVKSWADMKIAQIDLREIMAVKDFDLDKAGAAVKKIADIRTSHQLDMLKFKKDIRAILTDDQFKKMQEMMYMEMGKNKMMKHPVKRPMLKKQAMPKKPPMGK
ncbi:MAG: hypothetical protein PHY31_00945 [Smithellaceae bacterium]|nr:hypothetical protein [Smithellaceae bacterium]